MTKAQINTLAGLKPLVDQYNAARERADEAFKKLIQNGSKENKTAYEEARSERKRINQLILDY